MTTPPGWGRGLPWNTFEHPVVGVAELGVDGAVAAGEDDVGGGEAHRAAGVDRQVGGGDGLLGDCDDLRLRDVGRRGERVVTV